jgi:hypothetical protein
LSIRIDPGSVGGIATCQNKPDRGEIRIGNVGKDVASSSAGGGSIGIGYQILNQEYIARSESALGNLGNFLLGLLGQDKWFWKLDGVWNNVLFQVFVKASSGFVIIVVGIAMAAIVPTTAPFSRVSVIAAAKSTLGDLTDDLTSFVAGSWNCNCSASIGTTSPKCQAVSLAFFSSVFTTVLFSVRIVVPRINPSVTVGSEAFIGQVAQLHKVENINIGKFQTKLFASAFGLMEGKSGIDNH